MNQTEAKASHTLARMGSSRSKTVVWLRYVHDELNLPCQQDYNEPV